MKKLSVVMFASLLMTTLSSASPAKPGFSDCIAAYQKIGYNLTTGVLDACKPAEAGFSDCIAAYQKIGYSLTTGVLDACK